MELKGIHHVSAITAIAKQNYHFYTDILGLRLVKKSVNQDDPSMYHLFYADEIGRPGTDLTFFEIDRAGHTYQGNNSISLTALRVPSDEALRYWENRFSENNVLYQPITEQLGRKVLFFQDPEDQRLMLISDQNNQGVQAGIPWDRSPVPTQYGITGLGPVKLTVPDKTQTERVLTEVMNFRYKGSYEPYIAGQPNVDVYETGQGGTGTEVHIEERTDLSREKPGRGSVHHVAFRVADEVELLAWRDIVRSARMPNSGIVDRYYFKSLYFREPNGILYELATDGPGFATDESVEKLGEALALPPFLEDQRASIEARLEPLNTKRD
ncbi:putative ring-cleaving dioxygenase MhqA [Paraliobacillus ryukyuensis]|uniref:Glyoxalase family protein n=1 Tax=Paraliobacillus ryukyuensis TaxID=200904 RepID=A0A366EDF0_9BACI|nr:ring-cleaving dioxygenase [Paraliobacillus ryukyuensis]RBP00431.1 glyoxalase family protein [Paraliobacillus ryukyuensis]